MLAKRSGMLRACLTGCGAAFFTYTSGFYVALLSSAVLAENLAAVLDSVLVASADPGELPIGALYCFLASAGAVPSDFFFSGTMSGIAMFMCVKSLYTCCRLSLFLYR